MGHVARVRVRVRRGRGAVARDRLLLLGQPVLHRQRLARLLSLRLVLLVLVARAVHRAVPGVVLRVVVLSVVVLCMVVLCMVVRRRVRRVVDARARTVAKVDHRLRGGLAIALHGGQAKVHRAVRVRVRRGVRGRGQVVQVLGPRRKAHVRRALLARALAADAAAATVPRVLLEVGHVLLVLEAPRAALREHDGQDGPADDKHADDGERRGDGGGVLEEAAQTESGAGDGLHLMDCCLPLGRRTNAICDVGCSRRRRRGSPVVSCG